MTSSIVSRVAHPAFRELSVARGPGSICVRDYGGAGPAFVPMHGFPDNLRIYDDLVPALVARGRRVVTFDFLGFGASDKPAGEHYGFRQQLGDLEAVVAALDLEKISPVAHDSAGPAAINFALAHPTTTHSIVVLNSVYSAYPGLAHPELIELFATPALHALAQGMLGDPAVFAWVLDFQRKKFQETLAEEHRAYYAAFLGPIIDQNFRRQPSSAPAFAQMTRQLFAEEERNGRNLGRLRELDVPVKLIWGKRDPYLRIEYAEHLKEHFKQATIHRLDAGHWVQLDEAPRVADIMLDD